MKKNYGLKQDFNWEELHPDAKMSDYILIFDFDNFCIFCENTNKKFTQVKEDLKNI